MRSGIGADRCVSFGLAPWRRTAGQGEPFIWSEAFLEYGEDMRDLPIERQAPIYRQMVFSQTERDVVLMGVASQRGISRMLLAKDDDLERVGVAKAIAAVAKSVITVTVGYVGKADLKEAERYVRDFIRTFLRPAFVRALPEELEGNGIEYDLQDVRDPGLPNIGLPWSMWRTPMPSKRPMPLAGTRRPHGVAGLGGAPGVCVP